MGILTRRIGPLPGWAWLLIVAGVAYLYMRMRSSSQANAAAQQQASGTSSNLGTVPVSNLTTAAQPMPVQLGDTFVNSTTPVTVNASPSTTINNPPPSSTLQPAPTPAPPKQVAYGIVNTAQGLMDWLGVNTAGSKIFNVGGGAPVYFGNATTLAQGPQYETAGSDIYTPVGYSGQVATTALPLQQPYLAGH